MNSRLSLSSSDPILCVEEDVCNTGLFFFSSLCIWDDHCLLGFGRGCCKAWVPALVDVGLVQMFLSLCLFALQFNTPIKSYSWFIWNEKKIPWCLFHMDILHMESCFCYWNMAGKASGPLCSPAAAPNELCSVIRLQAFRGSCSAIALMLRQRQR